MLHFFFQILIASIMCGYSKEDWTELAEMAEVCTGRNCDCKKNNLKHIIKVNKTRFNKNSIWQEANQWVLYEWLGC